MKCRFLLFCLFWVAFSGKGFSQQIAADSVANPIPFRNSVYVELLGNGFIGSLNYERIINLSSGNKKMAIRAGSIFVPTGKKAGAMEYVVVCPFEVSYFFGKGMVKPDFGIGLTYVMLHEIEDDSGNPTPKNNSGLIPIFRVGIRWYYEDNPLLFRVGLMPLYLEGGYLSGLILSGGVSIGYSFGRKN